MNLIALVTLTKIIKIELCVLHSIAQRMISCTRFWRAFTHLTEQIRAYYTEVFEIEGYYKHEVNCLHLGKIGDHDGVFVFDLPCITYRLINVLVFEKLCKLEILALWEITEKQWESQGDQWRDTWHTIHDYITKHDLFGMYDQFVFYPCTPITQSINYFLSMFVIRVITRLEIICIEMLCFYSHEDWLDKEYLSDMIFQYTSERYPIFGFDHNLDDLLYDDPMFDSLRIKPSFSMLVVNILVRFEILCIKALMFHAQMLNWFYDYEIINFNSEIYDYDKTELRLSPIFALTA